MNIDPNSPFTPSEIVLLQGDEFTANARYRPVLNTLIVAGIFFSGLSMIFFGTKGVIETFTSSSWPVTEGYVVKLSVETGDESTNAHFGYLYRVAGNVIPPFLIVLLGRGFGGLE